MAKLGVGPRQLETENSYLLATFIELLFCPFAMLGLFHLELKKGDRLRGKEHSTKAQGLGLVDKHSTKACMWSFTLLPLNTTQ